MARKGPVLVVEDDHDVRVTLRSVLEDEGYEVWTATNGRDALELLKTSTHNPALAVIDLMMPLMDGWELIEILKRAGTLAALPVIVQSAFVDRDPPSGIRAFLKKPVDIDALIELVDKHCG
jgi:two-component system, OmpR family, response regulator CpxR